MEFFNVGAHTNFCSDGVAQSLLVENVYWSPDLSRPQLVSEAFCQHNAVQRGVAEQKSRAALVWRRREFTRLTFWAQSANFSFSLYPLEFMLASQWEWRELDAVSPWDLTGTSTPMTMRGDTAGGPERFSNSGQGTRPMVWSRSVVVISRTCAVCISTVPA